jgi:hypothetical protein
MPNTNPGTKLAFVRGPGCPEMRFYKEHPQNSWLLWDKLKMRYLKPKLLEKQKSRGTACQLTFSAATMPKPKSREREEVCSLLRRKFPV